MALSAEEKKQLQALLAKDKEPEEDSDDFFVALTENGRTVEMPHSKAKGLLKKWGFDLDEITEGSESESGEGSDDEPSESSDRGKPTGRGYFSSKK